MTEYKGWRIWQVGTVWFAMGPDGQLIACKSYAEAKSVVDSVEDS